MNTPRVDTDLADLEPEQYTLHSDGVWYGRTPNGIVLDLDMFPLEFHADGTLSATMTILVNKNGGHWRGTLEHGVWTTISQS